MGKKNDDDKYTQDGLIDALLQKHRSTETAKTDKKKNRKKAKHKRK